VNLGAVVAVDAVVVDAAALVPNANFGVVVVVVVDDDALVEAVFVPNENNGVVVVVVELVDELAPNLNTGVVLDVDVDAALADVAAPNTNALRVGAAAVVVVDDVVLAGVAMNENGFVNDVVVDAAAAVDVVAVVLAVAVVVGNAGILN
jgi:hypothetical protein